MQGRCCTARTTERTISPPGMQSLYHVPQTKLKRCECPVDLSVANIWSFRVVWNRSESWVKKSESKSTPRTTWFAKQYQTWLDYFLLGMAFFQGDVGLREAIQQLRQQTSGSLQKLDCRVVHNDSWQKLLRIPWDVAKKCHWHPDRLSKQQDHTIHRFIVEIVPFSGP